VGWARHRWTDPLFTNTFPTFAKSGTLARGGQIWLPNLDCIRVSLADFALDLDPYYTVELVRDPKQNPLYLATEDVEAELLMCPDSLTNETQLRPLQSDRPFFVLKLRDEFKTCLATPDKKRKELTRTASASSSASDSDDPYFKSAKKTRTARTTVGAVGPLGRVAKVASSKLNFNK
jgi:hypothetical protein